MALHLLLGLKSEDVMQGVRMQKSQVDSGTCGGAALLGSSRIATASFLLGKRQTGAGCSGSLSLGMARRFLAVKISVL